MKINDRIGTIKRLLVSTRAYQITIRLYTIVIGLLPFRGKVFLCLPRRMSGAVALTFDDGPCPETTPRILKILAAERIRTTFFVVGREAQKQPELIRMILDEGHSVGNHTFSHPKCKTLSRRELLAEIEKTDSVVATARPGARAVAIRPPWGKLKLSHVIILLKQGRSLVYWSRSSYDYCSGASEVALAAEGLRSGDIFLMHNRYESTIEALPEILQTIKRQGLTCVTIDEALGLDDSGAAR